MIIENFDFWEVIPAMVVFIVLSMVCFILLLKESYEYLEQMPLHRLWYRLTKNRRTKKGGLKYICYSQKKDLFYCKKCKGILTREDYDQTEEKPFSCPYCGQRLGRIFWI